MNLVVGDYVEFILPQFSGGSFYRGRCSGAKYLGDKQFSGTIEKESYGRTSGQHTFSIRLLDGSLKMVKGRNLYPAITLHREGIEHTTEVNNKLKRIEIALISSDCDDRVPARMRK